MLHIQQKPSYCHLDTFRGVKFNNPDKWMAYAGGYLRIVYEDSETKHNVKKIIIHDKYDPWEYFSSYNLGKAQKIKQCL